MATRTIYPYGSPGAVVGGIGFILVQALPAASSATAGAVYLVPDSQDPTIKDMYVTVQDVSGGFGWTQIGTTQINLTGYATEQWVEARDVDLTAEQYEALVQAGAVDPKKRYFVDET